jgi:excisionase family DNA binding protein
MTDTVTVNGAGVLYGARAIATFLGVTEGATYQLIHKRRIPFFKIGKTVCATKDGLLTAFRRMEAGDVHTQETR